MLSLTTSLPYWAYLLAISVFFLVAERVRPWRPQQKVFRPGLITDVLFLVFNGVVLAMILAPVASWIKPHVESWLVPLLGRAYIGSFPIWVQGLIAFFAIDFIKWGVHVTLHHVPWLWSFHKVHHSIVEMDWLGNMRFHWLEIVIYDSVLYIPMLLAGFNWQILTVMAIVSTAIGHFNHSNLKVSVGPLRYLLNHPGMHIWHHDRVLHFRAGCNFGINLSCWDWIFRTAYLPGGQPEKLAFPGIRRFPENFFAQQLVPLTTALKKKRPTKQA